MRMVAPKKRKIVRKNKKFQPTSTTSKKYKHVHETAVKHSGRIVILASLRKPPLRYNIFLSFPTRCWCVSDGSLRHPAGDDASGRKWGRAATNQKYNRNKEGGKGANQYRTGSGSSQATAAVDLMAVPPLPSHHSKKHYS